MSMKLTWTDIEAHKDVVTPRQWLRITAYLRDQKILSQIERSGGKSSKSAIEQSVGRGCMRILRSMLGQPVHDPTEGQMAETMRQIRASLQVSQPPDEARFAPSSDTISVTNSYGTRQEETQGTMAAALRELFGRQADQAAASPPKTDETMGDVAARDGRDELATVHPQDGRAGLQDCHTLADPSSPQRSDSDNAANAVVAGMRVQRRSADGIDTGRVESIEGDEALVAWDDGYTTPALVTALAPILHG